MADTASKTVDTPRNIILKADISRRGVKPARDLIEAVAETRPTG